MTYKVMVALLAVLVVSVACAVQEPQSPTPNDSSNATTAPVVYSEGVAYADGTLRWSAEVLKPTPCHQVRVEERVLESFPVQVVVELSVVEPDDVEVCAQVVVEETVSGELSIDHAPSSVLVRVVDEEPRPSVPVSHDLGSEGAEIVYADGVLRWAVEVEKPTPCHGVRVEERLLESYPVQVHVDLSIVSPPPGEVCIQVIAYEVVSGEIAIDHAPGNVVIRLNDEQIA
jgi:hypothetical protein